MDNTLSTSSMTVNRADLRPGQIVEVRQRYVVKPGRYPAGSKRTGPKMYPTGEPAEFVVVRSRWRVYRSGPHMEVVPAYWVAENGSNRELERIFDTHGEAIAYADRQARRPL